MEDNIKKIYYVWRCPKCNAENINCSIIAQHRTPRKTLVKSVQCFKCDFVDEKARFIRIDRID